MIRSGLRAPAPPKAPRRRTQLLVSALAVAATLIAFALGRWAGDRQVAARPPSAGHADPAAPDGAAAGSWAPVAPRAAAPSPAPAVAPAPAAAPSEERRARAETVARATEELSRSLEAARAGLAERCVPEARRAGGPPARVTFNITFDAAGREIARGISDDRRAPAPEVARCLRKLPMGALRVSAPGASVGVRVAMTLP